jgi:hypothetical protein
MAAGGYTGIPGIGVGNASGPAWQVHGTRIAVALLSLEMGRIEREWVDETKSYPRRARN